jgi:MoaA/NifB/PqqE/SkfB family radical SAM enzyme
MTCHSCGLSDSPCRNAFRLHGIHTVHWECWSACNLRCDFCYRSLRSPVDTPAAVDLVEAVAYAGATRLIFAGGDPSLRRDLERLSRRTVELGLTCEIQTNGQTLTPALASSLPHASRLYLSLDGASAAIHDAFRSKPGNFARVTRLLRVADDRGLPVTVHSVASRKNWQGLPDVLAYIKRFPCVDTWSVLQFSPSGAGYRARREHELPATEWQQVLQELHAAATFRPRVIPLGKQQKKGLYAMVSADGYAYRAVDSPSSPVSDEGRIGAVLDMHLLDVAAGWRIDPTKHQRRYVSTSLAGLTTQFPSI